LVYSRLLLLHQERRNRLHQDHREDFIRVGQDSDRSLAHSHKDLVRRWDHSSTEALLVGLHKVRKGNRVLVLLRADRSLDLKAEDYSLAHSHTDLVR
jgi:hypothetical protein